MRLRVAEKWLLVEALRDGIDPNYFTIFILFYL